jgi:hypothetical protein
MRKAVLVACLLVFGACSPVSPEEAEPSDVRTLARPTTGPYVSVAVDNHFHDIHPEDDIQIAADRTFIVKNQGRNLHNFQIGGTDIDENLRPGEQFELDPLGAELGPGVWTVSCKFHATMGMVGQFEVVE